MVDESIPDEEDIEWSVKKLQSNRSRVPLGTRIEYIRRWLEEVKKAETETATETETEKLDTPENNSKIARHH